ncbi:hypothetical protein B0H63DRAFT_559240 [Podospora didyma]|uniref:DUF676 domain-containing protein n=1 Tax=Podospora didyma TaxID=330526 RepID=A0AAE0U1V5_9PEZI|nr:hypothetical protein B0H63DRAFT_559240 [Podospora didyma]
MAFLSQVISRRSRPVTGEKNGLWELAAPLDGSPPSVDIVAIHGLGGDAYRTWTGDNDKLWLRDFLPSRLRDARIFTYGYDSVVAFSKSSAEVDDFARDLLQRVKAVRSPWAEHQRPLYLICHSLGGIVAKQALNIAHGNKTINAGDAHIIRWLSGVVFMGTPHAGSGVAFWASLAGKLLNTASLGTTTNHDLLKLLCRDSSFLEGLSRQFALENPQLRILSFYELEKFPFLNRRVVEKESARLDLPNETLVPTQANHRAMCRFNDPESQSYRVVEDVIAGFIQNTDPPARIQEPEKSPVDLNQRRVLNEWLDPTPTVDTFDRIRAERVEGSCVWIYENRHFSTWLLEPRWRVCHMDGPPGFGKSTLVTKLIEDLRVQHPVAFFFCRLDQESQSWKDIIRTWTWQLLEQRPQQSLMGGVFDMCMDTIGTVTPLANYFKALIWLVKKLDSPFIFLDGMDEDPQLQEVGLQGLSAYFRDLSKHAKIFTSSRPDPRVRYSLPTETGGFIRIAIKDHPNEQDISSFLTDGLSRLGWDEQTMISVHRKLTDGAKGMFLWAKLMLHHVQQQVTLDDLETALRELPDGLNPVYARILAQMSTLPPSQARTVARILQWTYSATRPLTISELEVALAVKPGSGSCRTNDRNRVLNIRQLIADVCSPLLEIDERSETIRFSHASVLQYLQSISTQGSTEQFITLTKRTPSLAATCLTYLAYADIDFVKADGSPDVYAANLDEHLRKYKFLRYASLNLWAHLPLSDDGSSPSSNELQSSLAFFFKDEKNLVRWLQLYQLLGEASKPRSKETFHPHASGFACLKDYPGFSNLGTTPSNMFVRWDRWVSEDSFNGHFCSPITIAAFFDLSTVVRQQLDAGIPVDDDLVFGYTPFLYAVHGDSLNTAKLLLAEGADPTKATVSGYNAARYASRNCLSVLSTILEINAPWTSKQDHEGRTVIRVLCSSAGWHPSVINAFLHKTTAAELDQQDFLGLATIHMAANINVPESEALMMSRLSRSSDFNGEISKHVLFTSLQEAFTPSTKSSITTWAHDWSVYLGIKNDEAFSDIAWQLKSKIVLKLIRKIKAYLLREIINRKPQINITDYQGRTALHIAAGIQKPATWNFDRLRELDGGDKENSIKTLLAAGANPFLQDRSGKMPVDIAIELGDWPTARLLSTQMQSRAGELPENDRNGVLDLEKLLNQTKIENRRPPKREVDTDWMFPYEELLHFPQSFQDVAQTAALLGSRPGLGRRLKIPGDLIRLVLDFAGYWAPAAAAVDIRTGYYQTDSFKVSLRLNDVAIVRKIEIVIATERRRYYTMGSQKYHALSARHAMSPTFSVSNFPSAYSKVDDEVEGFGHDLASNGPAPFEVSWARLESASDTSSFDWKAVLESSSTVRPQNGRPNDRNAIFLDHKPFLRWERSSEGDEDGVVPHDADGRAPPPPPIPGVSKLWVQATDEEVPGPEMWKQTWPVEAAACGEAERYGELQKQTAEWLASLQKGDTITLTADEGFIIQDIARFSKFGMVVYSGF